MIKVGVLGARGRMGRTVCEAVEGAPDTELGAQVDQGDALDALLGCDVVVDFTHVAAVMENLRWCVEHGLNVVVGTSGFGDERLAEVRSWLDAAPGCPRADRAELLRRRGADDALRGPGRPLLRVRRDHRAAPREQDGRPVRHRAAHGRA